MSKLFCLGFQNTCSVPFTSFLSHLEQYTVIQKRSHKRTVKVNTAKQRRPT
jgi:hypothetical protein